MKEYIKFNPGSETSEKYREWQGCPTIAITKGGRMFAGWYTGGAFEPCIDNFNVLIMSDDHGETWSKPILAVYTDYANRMRNIDIQLWVDDNNRLWVMWTHSPYNEGCRRSTIRTPYDSENLHKEFVGVEALICDDPDADELKWHEPRDICFGFLRCKPVIVGERYIFPAYDWVHEDNYYLRYSDDRGETFYDVPAAKKMGTRAFDETMVYEYMGRLRMLTRTNSGCIAYSDSFDAGKTWTETKEYQKAPSARFYIGYLKCGLLALVRAIDNEKRMGMKICLSDDGGESWKWEFTLDTRENLSYPDLCEDDSGNIYIIYDRERDNRIKLDKETWMSASAKEILVSKITVNDIKTGELSDGSYLSKVISKAKVDFASK